MKRRLLVIVLFVAFALVTAHAASAQERWSLVETSVNPNNELVEYYGGGTTPYWYTEPRYEGKLQVYTLTSTSFSVHDVEVDNGFVYYDVNMTTNFAAPPSELIPGQTVNLTANFSHSGVVDSYPPGVRFIYSGDVPMTPTTTFAYFPWHENFTGVSSVTYSFVVPNTHSGEIKIYASWSVSCALVVWTYQASGTAPGNNDPQLSMASLTPTTGTSETDFTFSVNYYDPDGDSPSVNQLIINDQSYFYPTLSSGSASNGTYSETLTNFPSGTHSYYFYFEDGQGGSARLPASGTYSGPTIGGGGTCKQVQGLSLSRSCGTVGQPVTITVTGASGLYYRYYLNDNSYCSSTGPNWILLRDWTTSNIYTWTPNSAGLKTIMVWSVVNTTDSCRGMAGIAYEVR